MNIIIEILSLFLEYNLFCIIFHKFLDIPLKPQRKEIIIGIIYILLCGKLTNMVVFSSLLWQFLLLINCISYKKHTIVDRILLYIFSYATSGLAQILLVFILSIAHITYNDIYMPIIGNLATTFIVLLLLYLTPYSKLYNLLIHAAFGYKLLFINSYIIITSILLFVKLQTHQFYENIIYSIMILSLIITFNVCILYYDQRLKTERQQIDVYRKNLPVYQTLISDIRASQHEFSNRLQTLENLPFVCKDYNSLHNALLKNTADYKLPLRAYPLLQLNTPLLAATLYSLYKKSLNNDLIVLFDIATTQITSNTPEYILSDLVGILMQNAIDASNSGETIYVQINSENKKFNFEIRNSVNKFFTPDEISNFFQKGFSTKKHHTKEDGLNHGLGLHYLLQQIQIYKGNITADCINFEHKFWLIFTLEI